MFHMFSKVAIARGLPYEWRPYEDPPAFEVDEMLAVHFSEKREN